MKKVLIITVCLAIAVTLMCGCTLTVKSDPATEQKLEGTWEFVETENEDGVDIRITTRETYTLADHRFTTKITMYAGSPVDRRIMTLTYEGEWRASKDMLLNYIDKGSLDFSFNNALFDTADMLKLKTEMTSELRKNDYREGVEIKSPITDRFIAEDDEGDTYTYRRVD